MGEELKNVAATVKWFKADKGYGFVRFVDGTGEAFLHSSVLTSLGDVVIAEGMAVICDVAEGQKGPQVTAIHAVTPGAGREARPRQRAPRGRQRGPEPGDDAQAAGQAAVQAIPRRTARLDRPREARAPSVELTLGTVRWYNLDSQSGIIDPADGGEGVFFDRITLREGGLEIVADGEEVWFTARHTPEGAVASYVELVPRF